MKWTESIIESFSNKANLTVIILVCVVSSFFGRVIHFTINQFFV